MKSDKSSTDDLRAIRDNLDAIDQQLVDALAARQRAIDEAAAYKADSGRDIRDYSREREILDRLGKQARSAGLNSDFVQTLYREIFDHSVRCQTHHASGGAGTEEVTVAYQGTDGAYSHLAAMRYFSGHHHTVHCLGHDTFGQAFDSVAAGVADYALLPVENTTAGSITEVHDLLAARDMPIVGEEVLHVSHCLVAPDKVPLQRIARILSHPQAVAQCSRFLSSLQDCEAMVYTDTAMAAQKVRDDGDPTQAAIASEEAARRYDLQVIKRHIADQDENYTRFVVISRNAIDRTDSHPSKTSLLFATAHERGALMRCLKVFDACDINLTKLESRPRPDHPWQYLFFVDIEGDAGDERVAGALADLEDTAPFMKVLGSYPAHPTWHS